MRRELVYDPVLRGLHAWNGLAILFLALGGQLASWLTPTPEVASLWRFHVWGGYALIVGLVGRAVWGGVGPTHARWSALWHPGSWLAALRSRRLFTEPVDFGHHPLASAVYLGLYGMLLILAVTGLALAAIDQGRGPLYFLLGHDVLHKALFRIPHEVLGYGVLVFITAHLAALILHERWHGTPLAQAMVSGYQYRPGVGE